MLKKNIFCLTATNLIKRKKLFIKLFLNFSFVLSFSLVSIFFSGFINSIFASTNSAKELEYFNSRLKKGARKVADLIIEKDRNIILAVVDVLNFDTGLRDEKGDLLEEQITELLYEMIPGNVLPYFEIVSLRMEWKNRYPEIKHDPLTEDIVKLSGADWLLTGTYKLNFDYIGLSLELFDLNNGNIIWDFVLESNEFVDSISSKTPSSNNFLTDSDSEVLIERDSNYLSLKKSFPKENFLKNVPKGMVRIPQGEFIMGGDFGDDDEMPDHLVYIKSFYIDKYEVTNLNFSSCEICDRGNGGFDSKEPEKPVVYVDWLNADLFCKYQKKRLPTEAEWEYVARAGSEGRYSFGEDIKILENYAWIDKNTVDMGLWGARDVGTKRANQWEVFDMHGNVMEWVQNYYEPNYFSSVRQQKNPTGPKYPLDQKYPLRVVRGGSWGGIKKAGTPEGVRSSKRYAFVEWTRSFQIGFRCAKDIKNNN